MSLYEAVALVTVLRPYTNGTWLDPIVVPPSRCHSGLCALALECFDCVNKRVDPEKRVLPSERHTFAQVAKL